MFAPRQVLDIQTQSTADEIRRMKNERVKQNRVLRYFQPETSKIYKHNSNSRWVWHIWKVQTSWEEIAAREMDGLAENMESTQNCRLDQSAFHKQNLYICPSQHYKLKEIWSTFVDDNKTCR
jgi:hypothetical protein